MDSMLQALLSWQFLIFCLAIAAITFVIRKIVEFILDKPSVPASKSSVLWTDLILPILPVVLGCICGLAAKKYPYPDGLNFISGRVAFGLVAGLLSTLVYRVVNSFLLAKIAMVQQPAQPQPTVGAAVGTAVGAAVDTNIDALVTQVRDTINK